MPSPNEVLYAVLAACRALDDELGKLMTIENGPLLKTVKPELQNVLATIGWKHLGLSGPAMTRSPDEAAQRLSGVFGE